MAIHGQTAGRIQKGVPGSAGFPEHHSSGEDVKSPGTIMGGKEKKQVQGMGTGQGKAGRRRGRGGREKRSRRQGVRARERGKSKITYQNATS